MVNPRDIAGERRRRRRRRRLCSAHPHYSPCPQSSFPAVHHRKPQLPDLWPSPGFWPGLSCRWFRPRQQTGRSSSNCASVRSEVHLAARWCPRGLTGCMLNTECFHIHSLVSFMLRKICSWPTGSTGCMLNTECFHIHSLVSFMLRLIRLWLTGKPGCMLNTECSIFILFYLSHWGQFVYDLLVRQAVCWTQKVLYSFPFICHVEVNSFMAYWFARLYAENSMFYFIFILLSFMLEVNCCMS